MLRLYYMTCRETFCIVQLSYLMPDSLPSIFSQTMFLSTFKHRSIVCPLFSDMHNGMPDRCVLRHFQ